MTYHLHLTVVVVVVLNSIVCLVFSPCVFSDGLLWNSRNSVLYVVWDVHAGHKRRWCVEDKCCVQKVNKETDNVAGS